MGLRAAGGEKTTGVAAGGNTRSAGRAADIAYVASLAASLIVLVFFGIAQLRIDWLGLDDFAVIWSGPRAFLSGADPYDPATWRATADQLAHSSDSDVYTYPPWVTVALLPFALFSPRVAGALWTVIGIAAAVIAVRALLRAYLPGVPWAHALIGLLLLLSPSAVVTLLIGQWTFFLVAGLATIVLLLRADRPVVAGIAMLVMVAKPPPFVFAATALGVRALWPEGGGVAAGRRFVISAIGAGVAAVAIAWLLIPSWWPAWFLYSAGILLGTDPVTIPTLLTRLFGPTGVWLSPLVLFAGLWAALQFHPRGDGWLPVWLAFSIAASVYLSPYDLIQLLVPIVVGAGVLMQRSPRRAALVLVSGAVLLFVVMYFLHTVYVRGYAEIVPLVMFAIITWALWPQRREIGEARLRGSAT